MKKIVFLIAFLISLLGCENPSTSTPISTPTPTTEKALNVPFDFQENQLWCWAATIKMVSDYYGHNVEQCEILSYWYGVQCCIYPSACNTTGSSQQIINTLAANRISSQWTSTPLSYSQVRQEIDSGRPLILGYRNSFSGHVVVLYGYTSNGEVMIYDPYFGPFTLPFGTSFVYGSGYSAMRWAETFYYIQPY